MLHLFLLLVKGREKDSELGIVNLSLQLPCFNSDFFFGNSSEKEKCGYNLFHSVIDHGNSCHFLSQLGRKLKPFATCLHSHVFPLEAVHFFSFCLFTFSFRRPYVISSFVLWLPLFGFPTVSSSSLNWTQRYNRWNYFFFTGVTSILPESSMSEANGKYVYAIKKQATSMKCFTPGTVYCERFTNTRR